MNNNSLAGGGTPSVIDFIKDSNRIIYPITHIDAIYDNNGKQLIDILDGYQPKGSYSLSAHDHDSVYSKLNHNHDQSYSKINHTHPAQTTITGNAGSATKLQTTQLIFGVPFNGTGEVYGQARVFGKYTTNAYDRYGNSGLQIMANEQVGAEKRNDIGYGPSIGFHWSNVVGTTLQVDGNGILHYFNQSGTTHGQIQAEIIGGANYLRTPRHIAIGNQSQPFDGSKDVVYTAASMGLLGDYSLPYNDNLNKVIASGVYRLSITTTSEGAPPNGIADWSQMLVLHGAADTITQVIFHYASSTILYRSGNPPEVGGSGQYTQWHEVIDRTRFNPCKINSSSPSADCLWAW